MERTVLGIIDKCAVDVQANLMLILVLGKMFPWLLLRILIGTS
jgi:hypothetical protein